MNRDTFFNQKIRLRYMEARLFLDGEVNQSAIIKLGVTRQVAGADFKAYLAAHKGVMRYDANLKKYILSGRHKPKLLHENQLEDFAHFVERILVIASKGGT